MKGQVTIEAWVNEVMATKSKELYTVKITIGQRQLMCTIGAHQYSKALKAVGEYATMIIELRSDFSMDRSSYYNHFYIRRIELRHTDTPSMPW
jgi:hypothetical protein